MYDGALIPRKCRNSSVNRSSEKVLTPALLSLMFFSHGLIEIRFGLLDYFLFLFYDSEILFIELMLLNFCCGKISFLCKHIFLSMRHIRSEIWILK